MHLFRHTTATLVLDVGTEMYNVAETLGRRTLEAIIVTNRVSMAMRQVVHATCHSGK